MECKFCDGEGEVPVADGFDDAEMEPCPHCQESDDTSGASEDEER